MDRPSYYNTVLAAHRAGNLSVVCEVVKAVGGDCLLITAARVPLLGPANRDTETVLCHYLIGSPDGLQRALMEQRIRKLANLRGLFVAELSAAHSGGLSGLFYALSDVGAERCVVSPWTDQALVFTVFLIRVDVVGPVGTAGLVATRGASRNFPAVTFCIVSRKRIDLPTRLLFRCRRLR